MSRLFLPALLCEPKIIAVLGLDAASREAVRLPGYSLAQAGTHGLPGLANHQGGTVSGESFALTDQQREKLGFLFAIGGLSFVSGQINGQTVALPASEGTDPVDAAHWTRRMAPVWALAMGDCFALQGVFSTAEIRDRLAMVLSRAHSRAMAQVETRPDHSGFSQADIAFEQIKQPYVEYFAVQEFFLRHKTYAGGESDLLRRAVFVAADAVTVMPYDPIRDRVMVVEQFRAGPLARGDDHPWLMEPVAGRIEPGDTPEQTAHKETLEEAGLTLSALHKIAGYYPSAGAFSEYLTSYIGIADLPDGAEGMHGVAEEGEDIRALILPREDLMARIASGEIPHGPLMISAYWLSLNRAKILAG
ncbi:MAG: NUDIX domain-containing protein [Mangrovicoccus sp.]|nr:NUDIX domain-containing protein [Mangrovicoccus sp.]